MKNKKITFTDCDWTGTTNQKFIILTGYCAEDDSYYDAEIPVKNLKWKKVED